MAVRCTARARRSSNDASSESIVRRNDWSGLVTGYNVGLFFHLLGVVTLFGGVTIIQLGGARLRAAATIEEVRLWLGLLRMTGAMFHQRRCCCLRAGSI